MTAPAGGFFAAPRVGVREAAGVAASASPAATGNRWAGFSVDFRRQFADRRQVVEDPDRPAVRADHQVVVLDHQVVDGHGRQVELERLPGRRRRRSSSTTPRSVPT